jgi:hypothetical protein
MNRRRTPKQLKMIRKFLSINYIPKSKNQLHQRQQQKETIINVFCFDQKKEKRQTKMVVFFVDCRRGSSFRPKYNICMPLSFFVMCFIVVTKKAGKFCIFYKLFKCSNKKNEIFHDFFKMQL